MSSNVYFTADLHLGHANVIPYCNRPFKSLHEMNKTILDNINSVVEENAQLYILGDFCWNRGNQKRAEDMVIKFREKINCKTVHLLLGNHDNKKVNYLKCGFASVSDIKEINVEKQKIVLCHYCMARWNKSHHGSWHLYGHSHGTIEEIMNEKFPERKSFDVGVDNCGYYPVSFEQAKARIEHEQE